MKPLPKLKWYISVCLGLIFFVVVISYTVLVYYSQLASITETAAYDMRLAARDFAAAYNEDRSAPLPGSKRMQAFIGERNLPAWLVKEYDPAALAHDQVTFDDIEPDESGLETYMTFILIAHDLLDGKRLYLLKIYKESDDIPDAFRYSDLTEPLVLFLGIGIITLFFLLIRFLFKKVEGSVFLLSDWAANLAPGDLDRTRPRFMFREIDELGNLIKTAVFDLHQAMTREHRFLRHASHELRTPIAVLRTNMDLLGKLSPDPGTRVKPVYRRMVRAVDSMQTLTETLLWLSRKEENMPGPETFDVAEMVDDLIRETRYLLAGKPVELALDLTGCPAFLPKVPCRIALGNLIRNAFQYTVQGRVEIRVVPESVIISNDHGNGPVLPEKEYGFGLGLSLVEQICSRLDLKYSTETIAGGYRAVISWPAG